VIGAEWILTYPDAYFGKAFEFDRVFFFKWSVNWQFMGEEVATGKGFAKVLIVTHLSLLLVFLFFKWTSLTSGLSSWFKQLRLPELFSATRKALDPRYVALSMFTCNLIGILCARSLHYQFYSWYYQTLPLILLYIRGIPLIFK
jgi:alpha-1,3-mannosyltransferase